MCTSHAVRGYKIIYILCDSFVEGSIIKLVLNSNLVKQSSDLVPKSSTYPKFQFNSIES